MREDDQAWENISTRPLVAPCRTRASAAKACALLESLGLSGARGGPIYYLNAQARRCRSPTPLLTPGGSSLLLLSGVSALLSSVSLSAPLQFRAWHCPPPRSPCSPLLRQLQLKSRLACCTAFRLAVATLFRERLTSPKPILSFLPVRFNRQRLQSLPERLRFSVSPHTPSLRQPHSTTAHHTRSRLHVRLLFDHSPHIQKPATELASLLDTLRTNTRQDVREGEAVQRAGAARA